MTALRTMVPLGALLLFSLLGTACGSEPEPGPDLDQQARQAELERLVAPVMEGEWTVGMIIGLLLPDGSTEVYVQGRPSANQGPFGGDTLFEIGSVSKTFTSLALADRVEEGTVTLEQPIQELLPTGSVTMPVNTEPITLTHLSTHTSGLPRMPTNFRPRDAEDPYVDYTVDDLYAYLDSATLSAAPGERWEYSNLGVGLLGHALALTDGGSWEAMVESRVTGPLGLSDTALTLTQEQAARFTQGHNADLLQVPHWNWDVLAGAGALRSSTNDLLSYLSAQGGLRETALADAIASTHSSRHRINDQVEIGLAWLIEDGRYVFHDGGTYGFGTWVGFDAQTGAGVTVLSNTLNPVYFPEGMLGAQLLRLVAGEETSDLQLPPTLELVPAELEKYVGPFLFEDGSGLEFALRDGRLYLELPRQSPYWMHASDSDTFYLRTAPVTITFDCASGTCDALEFVQVGLGTLNATRVP